MAFLFFPPRLSGRRHNHLFASDYLEYTRAALAASGGYKILSPTFRWGRNHNLEL
jgi:hypothetical protein